MGSKDAPGQLSFEALGSRRSEADSLEATQDSASRTGKELLLFPEEILESMRKNVPTLQASFAKRRPLSILVADDNEVNRKVIRVILQKLGYQCVEAENGEEALQKYKSGSYDYIFMDLDMPNMDGISATEAIRDAEKRSTRQCEIIAVTANVSPETRQSCRRVGMNGYLEKPVTASIIKEQLLRSWPRVRSRRKSVPLAKA